ANFRSANLSSANLNEIRWDGATHWAGAHGLHSALNVAESLAQTPRFKAAVVLSQGMDWVMQGNVWAAIQAYEDAQAIDTGLETDAEVWDLLCWAGALHNQAAVIQFASEKATHLFPDWPVYRDTRALVRALTGDLQGAIEEFESVLEALGDSGAYGSVYRWIGFGHDREQRREWLEALRLGQNPFTPDVLEWMGKEGGTWKPWGSE
ncbi:MAG: tetratricopeptide repeat protein, partial [Cyanobium sp.]